MITMLIIILLFLIYTIYKLKKKIYKKVCIFDIDNTLTHGNLADEKKCKLKFNNKIQPGFPDNSGSNNIIPKILNKCKNNNYGIAIATARSGVNSNNKQLKKYLNNLDPSVFSTNFFNSPRFQNACTVVKSLDSKGNKFCENNNHGDKAAMYYNIMNYYNISPTDWKNSIIFDDSIKHLKTAEKLTFKTCQASKECKGEYCSIGCGLKDDCLNIIR